MMGTIRSPLGDRLTAAQTISTTGKSRITSTLPETNSGQALLSFGARTKKMIARPALCQRRFPAMLTLAVLT